MNNVIIFGANGYLGRHLALHLKDNHIDFLPIGSSANSADNYENYFQIDITNKKEVEQLNFDVETIYIFAGLTGTIVGFDQYQEFILANEIGLLNILNHHKNCKSKARIVFPSTRLVYKGQKDVFLSEDAEKEALTIYAQTKLACESYLKMYQYNFGITYTVFRICVPYGNLINEFYSYGTLGFFLNNAREKKNITLYGDGMQKRTFTHVEDIIACITQTIELETTKNKIINIGSNDNLSLLEVANLVAKKYGVGVDFVPFPEEALKVESGDTIFDDTLQKKLINYTYKNRLSDWILNI